MNIRDIVNRDIVNLTNCDQEPIHIPGSIQPHGFLLAFTVSGNEIAYCSANTDQFLGRTVEDLLGKSLLEALDNDVYAELVNYLSSLTGKLTAPLVINIGDSRYHCAVHKTGNYWIAEFETVVNEIPKLNTIFDYTVQFLSYIEQSATLQQLCARVAEETRNITGYDRVMIYRFDNEYNGEIYAESKRHDLEPFLGLHYPHTDIPVQARQLYITNLVRMIPDLGYTPVPIYTNNESADANLDLSLATLRSVSPIHVQYLQNMGVGATLVVSLLHEGRLWGLISCHHYSPKYVDPYTRINVRLQGHFLTAQIKVRQLAEEYAVAKEVNVSLEALLNKQFDPVRASLQYIAADADLLALCNASGVAILLDGTIYKNGKTPPDAEIAKIATWAAGYSKKGVFSTSKLIDHYPDAATCPLSSGVIFYSLSVHKNAAILWFNPETLEEVHWAGDPEKAIIKDENGLHPRKSFETWKQVVKCKAKEWKAAELTAAANFAYNLQKHITLILLTEEEQEQREMSRQLRETNAELENINWLSTHDLKEPLRKIQMFSSRILERIQDMPADLNKNINKVIESASRMQHLLEDLTAYSRLRQTQNAYALVDLNDEIIRITAEFAEEIEQKEATIVAEQLPVIKGIPVLTHQLFANLVSNSIKFARPGIPARITVTASDVNIPLEGDAHPKPYHKITLTDNGIGFDNKFGDRIFKIFTRLHTVREYEGSGMGLALCRKIMQIHKGDIKAESTPGEGATFHLYFPIL